MGGSTLITNLFSCCKRTNIDHSMQLSVSSSGLSLVYDTHLGLLMAMLLTPLPFVGSVNIMRYGAGPNGITRTLGQYMLGSGATFGYAQ